MTALEARVAELRRLGQLDVACDVALAAGAWTLAAELAEEGGAHRRAARIWLRQEAWTRAEDAFVAAGDLVEAARVCLQTGRPQAALRRLPPEAKTLRAIAFAQLECWHAAEVLVPALAGPDRALLAQLAAQADAIPFASRLQFAEAEPDAPNQGWVGWLNGQPVATRQLPDRTALAETLLVFDPPLPGAVQLVDVEHDMHRLTTRRPGFGLHLFARQAASDVVERVMERTADILRGAHRRGAIHGMLLAEDIRVLPALGVVLDGWHRRHLEPVDGPWSARLDAATPPEIALGQPVSPATDAWCLARVRALFDLPYDAQALAPDPASRPLP